MSIIAGTAPSLACSVTTATLINTRDMSGARRHRQQAYLTLDQLAMQLFRLQPRHDDLQRLFHLQCAAQENVERSKARFRPGMNGKVGFGQQQHAGDALLRPEVMKMSLQHGRPGMGRRLSQEGFDRHGIAQTRSVDAIQIGQQMLATGGEGVGAHLCPPPPPQDPPELEDDQLLPEDERELEKLVEPQLYSVEIAMMNKA